MKFEVGDHVQWSGKIKGKTYYGIVKEIVPPGIVPNFLNRRNALPRSRESYTVLCNYSTRGRIEVLWPKSDISIAKKIVVLDEKKTDSEMIDSLCLWRAATAKVRLTAQQLHNLKLAWIQPNVSQDNDQFYYHGPVCCYDGKKDFFVNDKICSECKCKPNNKLHYLTVEE